MVLCWIIFTRPPNILRNKYPDLYTQSHIQLNMTHSVCTHSQAPIVAVSFLVLTMCGKSQLCTDRVALGKLFFNSCPTINQGVLKQRMLNLTNITSRHQAINCNYCKWLWRHCFFNESKELVFQVETFFFHLKGWTYGGMFKISLPFKYSIWCRIQLNTMPRIRGCDLKDVEGVKKGSTAWHICFFPPPSFPESQVKLEFKEDRVRPGHKFANPSTNKTPKFCTQEFYWRKRCRPKPVGFSRGRPNPTEIGPDGWRASQTGKHE